MGKKREERREMKKEKKNEKGKRKEAGNWTTSCREGNRDRSLQGSIRSVLEWSDGRERMKRDTHELVLEGPLRAGNGSLPAREKWNEKEA